jgi:hypothetical protein
LAKLGWRSGRKLLSRSILVVDDLILQYGDSQKRVYGEQVRRRIFRHKRSLYPSHNHTSTSLKPTPNFHFTATSLPSTQTTMKLDQATAGCAFAMMASVAAAPYPERLAPAVLDRSVASSENAAAIVAKNADPMPEPKAAAVISVSRDVVTKTSEIKP